MGIKVKTKIEFCDNTKLVKAKGDDYKGDKKALSKDDELNAFSISLGVPSEVDESNLRPYSGEVKQDNLVITKRGKDFINISGYVITVSDLDKYAVKSFKSGVEDSTMIAEYIGFYTGKNELMVFCMKEKLEYDKEYEKNFSSFEAIKGVKISIT